MKEEKRSSLSTGNSTLNHLLTSLQFYFRTLESILGEPRRKDSKDKEDMSESQRI